MIESYLNEIIKIPYLDLGRDKNGCDCYGLVRLIFKDLTDYDLPLFASVHPNDKRLLTNIVNTQTEFHETTIAKHLHLVVVKNSSIATHIAICIEDSNHLLRVVDTNKHKGVCIQSLDNFKSQYLHLSFYAHSHL